MKIDEAVEIFEDIIHYVEAGDSPEEYQAIQLAIEALKRIQTYRFMHIAGFVPLLPGETAEVGE